MGTENNHRMDPPDPLSDYEPTEYSDAVRERLAEQTVDAIECQPCLSDGPTTTVRDAIVKLNESGVSSMLIVEDGRLLGIFTERDVLENVVECYDRVADHPVSEFMTTDPTIVYSSDPSAAALAAIAVAGHRHVPVLDLNEKVYGIASARRVFEFIDEVAD